ncbi:MAG: NAD(+)/NADH kinase [Deltaproteobacteria bacterium]|nr:NAD(+)/NADH kinase [Deltaproteobacteria bacterium]
MPTRSADDPSEPDPDWAPIARRLAAARLEHKATLLAVEGALARPDVTVTWLAEPSAEGLASADLIVSVGGDGTFLTVARFAGRAPLLGVNSSPTTSVGHYCAATADTFGDVLAEVLTHLAGAKPAAPAPSGGGARIALRHLTRIRAEIGGVALPFEALNDVLFAHRVPVASTRYGLHIGERHELQLSSGIWIATASGSTAAIRSAGGAPMDDDDARLQWRVREPYVRGADTPALGGGLTDLPIEILSRSDKNALFLDGQPEPHTVAFGTRARLTRSPEPLAAYLPPSKRG